MSKLPNDNVELIREKRATNRDKISRLRTRRLVALNAPSDGSEFPSVEDRIINGLRGYRDMLKQESSK